MWVDPGKFWQIVYEQWKLSKKPPGRRRSKGAGKSTAVEDFAIYSVDAVQEAAAAGEEGDKE